MFIKYVDVFMDEGYASDSSNVRILIRILIAKIKINIRDWKRVEKCGLDKESSVNKSELRICFEVACN